MTTFTSCTRLISVLTVFILGTLTLGGSCLSSPPPDGGDADTCRCDTTVQVEIQARFIAVSDNFLDDINIDLNTPLQFGSSSSTPRAFFPANSTDDRLGLFLGLPESPSGDALAALIAPPSIVSPLALRSTLLTQSKLSDLLVEAANQRETVFTGPRITLERGESAFIMLKNEDRFISEVNSTFVNALTNVDQFILAVTAGPALELEPRGAEDGTIVLRLRHSIGLLFTTPDLTGDRPLVQLPRTQTTVRIPDGGTVLLGGVLNTSTGARAPGVMPVLGNVPIVSRLFDNRLVRENENLIVLITPRIVNDSQ